MKKNIQNMTLNKLEESLQIPWHPAFIEALRLELDDYKDVLEFHPELQLTTEPLRIDCVVIKKKKEVEIKKNIGRIFRTWNLIEYKSPDDYVSVSDFYKVYGYACIYTFLNGIPVTDLTITFVESRYPKELIKHLRNIRRYTVAETEAGVYTVSGDILPIQIIDSRKLSAEDNVWLKNLSNKLNRSDFKLINNKIAQQGKSARIAAYAFAIAYANFETIKEANMTIAEIELGYEKIFKESGWAAKMAAIGANEERQKWTSVVADKDAEIARLRAELESKK